MPNLIPFPRRGRRWTRARGHARRERGFAFLLLSAAACAGFAAGLSQAPVIATPRAAAGEAIQAGLPRAKGARNDAVRASFSYCYRGGGTNCVVDGDTFWIGGEKVRIAGIDAPETHPPRCQYEAQLGEEATEKLHALLNSGAVTMTSIDRNRDRYGRLLRNVAVNGEDVGEAMVSAGVARDYAGGRRPWC